VSFEAWLYETHPESELRRWATSLRFFRFCRAYGGHANDGDSFKAALHFNSAAELIALLGRLSVDLNPLPRDEPRPIPNHPYSWEEFSRFRDPIPDFPQWEQPGLRTIDSVPAFLSAESGALVIQLAGESGNEYAVAEDDFRNAQKLEPMLLPLAEHIIDPPQDNRLCVCPKYHPRLWEAAV
jgi:hypothetical protein